MPVAFSSQLSITSPIVPFLTPSPASSWVLVAGNERQTQSLNGSAMLHHNRAHDHPPPLTPSRVFEEDIYKPLVWQRGEGWLFYLPDLSCVTRARGEW